MTGRATPRLPADEPTFEDLYDRAPLGYLSLLADGTIIRVNDTLLAWLGADRTDVVGLRRLPDLLTVGGRVYYETHCAPLLAGAGELREIALDLRCVDGSTLPVLLGARVLPADGEREPIIRATIFDVSHRRAYERALQTSRDSERAARERSESLQRLAMRLASLSSTPEVTAALTGELVGGGAVSSATVTHQGAPATEEATFVAGDGGSVLGQVPLTTADGTRLGTLQVVLAAQPTPDEETFLQAAAEIGARSLERIRRADARTGRTRASPASDLPTRRWWASTLGGELQRAVATRRHLTLVAVDLPQFDQMMQTRGSVAADELMLRVADAWRSCGHDLLSPHGDHRFVAVLPGMTTRDAQSLVNKVASHTAQGARFRVGVAQWDRLEDGDALLERAQADLATEQRLRSELGL